MHKCHFGAREIDFLGRTITPQGVKPQRHIVQNFFEKTKFPKSKKALQRCLGFLNYYKNYVPRLSERLAPFYKLLKSDEKVLISKELVQQFEEINRALDNCCDLALQQPILNKQIALKTNASFGAAGYAVLIDVDPSQKFTSIRKSYARYRHYASNQERIVVKEEILTRHYFDETGNVKYHQILLPQHLLQELLQSFHGTALKHPGILKMLQKIRQRYYYPSMAKYV